MPIGYAITAAVIAGGLLAALVPLRRRGPLGVASWVVSAVPNESPFLAMYWLLAASALAFVEGDLTTPLGAASVSVAVVGLLAGPELVRRGLRSKDAVEGALAEQLGLEQQPGRRLPWFRILVAPLPVAAFDLRRTSNVPYGDAGSRNRLDIYRSRRRRPVGPVMIHLHGGRFVTGRKSFEGRPLLHRLARNGWVCISANYRLAPAARWPDFLVDAKKVVAWTREHARELGADPDQIFVSGSSAGAHLAITAALTGHAAHLQPGFEDRDTSVAGAIGLYGYYGPVDVSQPIPSAPADYVGLHAPPLMIADGDQDTYVPPDGARELVAELRAGAGKPVVYVELPGGQHSFDLLHSIRFESVINGVEAFADSVIRAGVTKA